MTQPTQDLYTELYDQHYKHVQNWNGIDPDYMAKRHLCSVDTVRFTMRDIEREYPLKSSDRDHHDGTTSAKRRRANGKR